MSFERYQKIATSGASSTTWFSTWLSPSWSTLPERPAFSVSTRRPRSSSRTETRAGKRCSSCTRTDSVVEPPRKTIVASGSSKRRLGIT
jgi:hypothetical protein